MNRPQALRLAAKHGQPIVVANDWGRFDYALPGGITAHADTKDEVETDLTQRGFDSYLLVKPEYLTPCALDTQRSAA